MRRTLFLLAAALHLCILVLVGNLAARESAIFDYGPVQDSGFRSKALTNTLDTGYSHYSAMRLMSSCASSLSSFEQQLARPQDQTAFAQKCKSFADAIIQTAPHHSFAWIVSAMSAQQAGDLGAMNAGLLKSQMIAPNEQWLAISRYQLASEHLDSLTPEAIAAYDADLALLAQSTFGVRAIAERYVSNPDFRDRITGIVSNLPNDTQRRFLNSVKTVIKNNN
jgi:hypothetical protein